jgi:cytochrome c oxidase subunit 2
LYRHHLGGGLVWLENYVRNGPSSRQPHLILWFCRISDRDRDVPAFITAQTIPWVEMDLNRADYQPDKVFDITVEDHQFHLPAEKLTINCRDTVLFKVTSNDLTYGFGLFRQDNSMVLQMQVVPGHKNDILWQFNKSEVYSIRSTEYSGPKGFNMIEKDAVEVVGCQ